MVENNHSMMYSFEGDFRVKPQQSFAGASRKEKRETLLHRAAVERQKRENARKRTISAIKIQAFLRGSFTRFKQKKEQRIDFDKIVKLNPDGMQEEFVSVLLQKLAFFCSDTTEDVSRLIYVAQMVLREMKKFLTYLASNQAMWKFKLMKLIRLCLNHLVGLSKAKQPIAIPMRILEVFTSLNTYVQVLSREDATCLLHDVMRSLVSNGFFQRLRVLVDEMIPASISFSSNPPTHLSASLFEILLKPLLLLKDIADEEYRITVSTEMCRSFFCPVFTNQVCEFVLPAMSSTQCQFPFDIMMANILNVCPEPASYRLRVDSTPWLLNSILTLAEHRCGLLPESAVFTYMQVLKLTTPALCCSESRWMCSSDSDAEDDADMEVANEELSEIQRISQKSVHLFNKASHVHVLVSAVASGRKENILTALSHICHCLLRYHKHAVHNYRLLYTVAFRPEFLRYLWKTISATSSSTTFGSTVPLLHLLSRGLPLTPSDRDNFVPLLSLFCSLLTSLLGSLHDSEFYGDSEGQPVGAMPFQLAELASMGLIMRDVCLGLIELAYPNSKPIVSKEYWEAMLSVGGSSQVTAVPVIGNEQTHLWEHLFKVALNLMRQIYLRDTRQRFCPKDHWISKRVIISPDRASEYQIRRGGYHGYRPFSGLESLTREDLEREGPPLSTTKIRNITILRELPFVVPFQNRVMIFQQMVLKDKLESQGDIANVLNGPQIQVLIRRNYIYEDAFDKLSPENEPNLKLRMRVQLVNAVGLDEAGIDGGGICREFLNELLKTCFNPNQGFFKLTHDNLLYPNPSVHLLVESFAKHFYFVGRMLGKAVYENMLIELPFAGFFLSKLLGRNSANVDIDHLNSLDPLLYKNLLSLKNYEGDVADLGLDFTVVNNEFGEAKVEELLPGGSKIPVTEANKIKYIHVVADYKLNRQIHSQCSAFKQGLANVINLEWLQMFDWKELQTLISGAQIPIDVADLQRHTNYSSGYSSDHYVIVLFWKVVEGFNDKQKRQLLKFVTSCSRPPLLGFKELFPPFCIQSAGVEERLPTSSTCMNLLKLPEFKDEATMRDKLLYAIESGSGFELS